MLMELFALYNKEKRSLPECTIRYGRAKKKNYNNNSTLETILVNLKELRLLCYFLPHFQRRNPEIESTGPEIPTRQKKSLTQRFPYSMK